MPGDVKPSRIELDEATDVKPVIAQPGESLRDHEDGRKEKEGGKLISSRDFPPFRFVLVSNGFGGSKQLLERAQGKTR